MADKKIEAEAVQKALKSALSDYLQSFRDMEDPASIYRRVLDIVEPVVLTSVMKYTHDNQSKAAQYMGINRATLRTKLKRHNML